MFASVLLLMLYGGGSIGSLTLPIEEAVELELISDRSTYQVGEPVQLALVVKNASDAPLFGYPWLQPYWPASLRSASLLYCRSAMGCVEFLARIPNIDLIETTVPLVRLAPGARERSEFGVAFNPASRRLVLDQPGDYEIRWVTWGLHARDGVGPLVRGSELQASVFIRVLPVPVSEREAFTYYAANDLGELAQYDPSYFVATDKLRLAAHGLLARYPDSAYAAAIRRGFFEWLEHRARAGQATPEDLERLAELRARRSGR